MLRRKVRYLSGAIVEHPHVGDESRRKQTVADKGLQLLREVLRRLTPSVPLLLEVAQQSFRPGHLYGFSIKKSNKCELD